MYSVLYVDDEPGLLEIGKLFLEQSSRFNVDTITSAPDALTLLNYKSFDAIVADYQMPGMDGIEFLKRVRSSGNTIPFILFTGRGREEIVIQALNEGADFYLQKGGEPRSQFTELAHKIRQAVEHRKAETSVRDLERREADIINFLPDATFAVDVNGVVIAWNRAIEEMTNVSAAAMLGKGNYEYSIPFYGQRQLILIDLINESDEVIATHKYVHIHHDKNFLIADTTLLRDEGKSITLMCKASPLYNREGEVVGAIESIRDITVRKLAEDALKQNEYRLNTLVAFYQMTSAPLKDLMIFAVEEAVKITASSIGYLAFVSDDESVLTMYAWSSQATKECQIHKKPIEYPLNTTGLWGEAVRQRRPVITNDYAAENPLKKGYPKGHVPIIRHMNIPVFDGARIVMIAGVGNKTAEYDEQDIRELTVLMSSLWSVIKQRRAEEELKKKNEELTASYEQISAAEEELRANVDELTHRELALRESEKKYRLLLEGLYDSILVHRNTKILYLNPGCEKVLGYSRDALLGQSIMLLVPPEFREMVTIAVRNRMAGKTFEPYELDLIRGDGSRISVLMSGNLVDFEGAPASINLIIDISSRKRAEQALQESEKRFHELTDLLPQIIYEADADGNLIYANRIAFDRFGYTEEDFKHGLNVREMFAQDDLERVSADFRTMIEGKGGQEHKGEYMALRKDGSTFPVTIHSSPIVVNGRITGLRGIIIDITERKRAEVAIRQMNKKLNLLSVITRHDITNQLTMLVGFLQILEMKQPDSLTNEYFQKAKTAAERISDTIRFTKEYENLGVHAPFWQDCHTLVETAAKDAQLGSVTMKNDLPAGFEVFADPLIVKVFFNLIDNALRYGGKITTIRFSAEESDGDHIVVCEDDGIGISAVEKEKIFDRGFGKNTGLGLFLAREILDITGITIRETGEEGKGARFEIMVPKGMWRMAEKGS